MPDMIDYNGPFDPDFSHDKLSNETLLKLLKAYAEYMLRIDGYWYLAVMDKYGDDEAFDCDMKVWQKGMLYELKALTSVFNIVGTDVATVMKAIQVSPWMWNYRYEIDIRNSNHAIVTFHTCPTLFALEKEGTGRENRICQEIEPMILGTTARFFNPDIKVNGLRVPPRTTYDDICCQWEFMLDTPT